MKRRIIQLGNDTFVVSLPSVWVKHSKLKKGDELEVEEVGPKLVIFPSSEARSGKVSVDVSGTRPLIKRVLGALYKVGYDEFEVRFESAEELSAIKEVVSEFVGFELIEEGKSHVVVRNVSNIIQDEFKNIQRKILFIINTMAQDSLKAMREKDWKKLQLLADMDLDVNKYTDFCRRILNTVGHKVVKRVPPSYYIVEQLERIGDSYRDMCVYSGTNKVVAGPALATVYEKVNEFFRMFQKAYYDFDLRKLAEFAKVHYQLIEEFKSLTGKISSIELPMLLGLKIAELDIFDMNGAVLAEML